MNSRLKQWALAGVGTGLALTIAFGVVGTSFAQSTTQDQGQTQQDGSSFAQRGGPGGMHRGGKGGFAPTVIAEALGITEDELHTAMQDGVSVSDLASEKGVSLDTIINAVIADETAELAQAVTDGKLTQEQADQRIADMTEKLPDMLSQVPPTRPEGMGQDGMGRPGGMGHGGKMGGPGSQAVIAEALGITEDELHTAMQDGVSVSDLASEKGVSLDTIVNAVIADETAELAQAVTDGKLTQEQADQRIADMTEKLPDQLSQVPPARPEGMGPRGMGGPGGHGRHGGFDQNGQPDSNQQAPDSNSGSSSSSSVAPAIQTQNTNL